MLRASKLRPRPTGFTLIELMFVVVLIGVLAAAVVPDLNKARADAQVANAASALVRLGSRARAHATFTGLAHVLAWLPDNGQGSVQLFRGISPRCNSTVWNWNSPIDGVTAADARYTVGGVNMQLAPPTGGPVDVRICIQPNGSTLLRSGDGAPFTEFLPGGLADVTFELVHLRGGVRAGAARLVVFPNGNLPRWVQ